MSRSEDYLDNLLTSVTDKLNEFDDDFEQNRESFTQSYQTQNDLPPRTQSALDEIRDDNFLREFEQDFQADNAEDDFIRAFEQELGGNDSSSGLLQPDPPAGGDGDSGMSDLEDLFRDDFQGDPVLEDLFSDTQSGDSSFPAADDVQTSALDDSVTMALDQMVTGEGAPADEDLTMALDSGGSADSLTTALDNGGLADSLTTALDNGGPEDSLTTALNQTSGEMDFSGEENTIQGAPEGMEGLDDIFGSMADDGAQAADQPAQTDSQSGQKIEMDPDLSAEIDSGLSQILSESDEEALAELGDLLNPQPAATPAENESPGPEKEDPFAAAEDFSFAQSAVSQKEDSGKKQKREKQKNPNSIFARLSHVLFGTPEELDPEAAAEYAAAKAAAGGEMDEKELKAKKKEEKELKKQQKKEAAELKKQEKEAAKAEKAAQKAAKAAAKPKKEKKPKKKGPKEPPLPKVPVIMMWTLAGSMLVLILLTASLLGYSAPVSAAKEAFENKDYVTAYARLKGVKIKKADKELYESASTLAGIQTQLNAYQSLMENKQYEMALDALVRGAGRCQLHSADAQEWGVSGQLEELETKIHQLLKEQFDVSKRRARLLYKISKRSEYTLELHEILNKLGLY